MIGRKLGSGACGSKKFEGEYRQVDEPQTNPKGLKMHTFAVHAAHGFDEHLKTIQSN
jgi:hypothetical protein